MAFVSKASNLVPDDTNGVADAFVWDRGRGRVERVSLTSSGAQANGDCEQAVISADGRWVAFCANASNLVEGGPNLSAIYLRDRVEGTTVLVSRPLPGKTLTSWATNPAIDSSGSRVSFESPDTALVSDKTTPWVDVYVCERATGALSRVSLGTGGVESDGDSGNAALSADGRTVAFDSSARNMVATPFPDYRWRVYVRDLDGATNGLVSVNDAGEPADDTSVSASLSADGNRVAFHSYATNLGPGNTGGQMQAYLRDRLTGMTTMLSVNPDGQACAAGIDWVRLSEDGRHASISTRSPDILTPLAPATKGQAQAQALYATQVVVRDLQSGVNVLASRTTSGTMADQDCGDTRLAPDGSRVWFESTATNLDGPAVPALPRIFERDFGSGITRQAIWGLGGAQPDDWSRWSMWD